VNEAYVRLIDWKNMRWRNRAHLFAVRAQMMRRILVDYARSRGTQKNGAGAVHVSFDEAFVVSEDHSANFVALDDALQRLAEIDARKSRVVELRFFGGLTVEETAEVLKIAIHGHPRLETGKSVALPGNHRAIRKRCSEFSSLNSRDALRRNLKKNVPAWQLSKRVSAFIAEEAKSRLLQGEEIENSFYEDD
jgi:hypothetical protein